MKTYAVDFESYYSKTCSIEQGLDNYVKHPEFDCYMVSIYGEDLAYVGPPSRAPWDAICGHRWVSHNRGFDEGLWSFLGHQWTGGSPAEWHCTADLTAYHGLPRSLKEASKHVLGEDVSKTIRDGMRGKQWAPLPSEQKKEVAAYALTDAKLCWRLWNQLESNWPAWERELSRETTRMCRAGVPANKAKLDSGIETLRRLVSEARNSIPWYGSEDDAALSPIAWAKWVREQGLEPPPTTAKDDPATRAWVEEHPEGRFALEAMWILRGANAMLKKLETMQGRVRPDGRLPFGLKYFGAATTGRDSGDSGFNIQNLAKDEMYGVDIRGVIEAPEGRKLVVADLSQIEARGVAWLAGDRTALDLARSGLDWYEAAAVSMGLYDSSRGVLRDTDPKLRRLIKALMLGCQYGIGALRFSEVAGMSLAEAEANVALYRSRNPKVRALWDRLKRGFHESCRIDSREFNMVLPSGRTLRYRDVDARLGMSAMLPRGSTMARQKVFAGFLLENLTQALCRDIFMDRVMELVRRGLLPCMRIHDEVVVEVDEADAAEAAREIEEILSTPPDWIRDIPLAAEVQIYQKYQK